MRRTRAGFLRTLARMATDERLFAARIEPTSKDAHKRVERAEHLARATAYDNAAEMARSLFREEDERR